VGARAEAAGPSRAVHDATDRLTMQWNTLPSGHVAGSLAVAMGIAGGVSWVTALFVVLAISMTIACIVGRYHYVADAVTGALLAGAVWLSIHR